ncbi:family 16 glycosylhydrolase [Opitutus terrae]|uniref:family 16 glycosylhydrolase n=1 Tax=Opitutus terrae TaxID=107709 RepID=UPI0011D15DC3|nr:family 16 glycosylhydrolase [Opitutus terrae]
MTISRPAEVRGGLRRRGGFAGGLLVVAALWLSPAWAADAWAPGAGWTLVWADEFDGTAIDTDNWTYDLGAGGWGNNEKETYTKENAFLENGTLVIEARKNPDGSYTSSRLKGQGRRSWKYGKVAARIRLPQGQGIWPAFWMLGDTISSVGWPRCGEIDIMEMIGGGENRDDTIYGTLHWEANGTHASYGSGARELPDPQFLYEDYHVFEIEWSEHEVIWKRDAVEYFRTSVDTTLWPTMAEFHAPFFILLNLAVGGNWPGNPDATTVFPQRMAVDWVRVYQTGERPPTVITAPASQTVAAGSGVTLAVTAGGTAPAAYHWRQAGRERAVTAEPQLTIAALGAADAGDYDVVVENALGTATSRVALVGITSTGKVLGTGQELTPVDIRHPNGNVFDQVLLTGAAEAITADAGQVTRTSFIDTDGDIVQVEFSGPGTLSLVLDAPTGPAKAEKYNQDNVSYMKGHAGIVIAGATEQTNVSVFSVGKATAVNQTLFKDGVSYDGVADLAFIAILSSDGKFGGIRAANATFFTDKGHTGIYAPGVEFTGPVFVGDVSAYDHAKPVLVLGSAADVRVAGGDFFQDNGESVQVSGVSQLKFTAGSDSHGRELAAQRNRAVLMQDGQDVTARVVVNP